MNSELFEMLLWFGGTMALIYIIVTPLIMFMFLLGGKDKGK